MRAYDQNLFTERNSGYGGRGVLIYWHVEKKSTAIHSQLSNCATSEVAEMLDGTTDDWRTGRLRGDAGGQ